MAQTDSPLAPPDSAGCKTEWRRWLRLVVLLAVLVVLALSLRPARMRILLSQGQQALEREDFEAAREYFQQARQVSPEAPQTRFWLARAHRKLGEFDAVRQELDAAKRLGYEDSRRLQQEWWLVLAEAGHLSEVESRLPELLQNSDEGAEVCEAFTNGYCLHLRFGEAEALIDAWQSDYPNDYRPYLRRGQIHASLEAWPQAAESLREALARAPGRARIHRELAEALFHQGLLEEAQEGITAVLNETPDDAEALATSAEILRQRKQFDEAEVQLRRLLTIRPDDFDARLSLAKVMLAAGRPADAVQEAETLAREWPEDLETVYTLAQALRAAGRTEDAEAQFESYAKLTDVIARLEDLKIAVKANPEDHQTRFELGRLLMQHVSREEGVAYVQSVLLYDSNHDGAHRLLADYHSKRGNADIARRHREFAASISQEDPDVTEPLSGKTP